ncbi:hypothetical protein D3C81_1900910 [compost metagenome]
MAVQRIARLNRTDLTRCHQIACVVRLPRERVGIGAHIVIGMVIPTGGTDTKAHILLVDHVQLGQQIDPLGHCTANTEVLVAVVEVGGVGDLRILTFHPLTITGLEGVIEAHSPVFTTIAEFKSMGGRHGREQNCCGQQVATQRAES